MAVAASVGAAFVIVDALLRPCGGTSVLYADDGPPLLMTHVPLRRVPERCVDLHVPLHNVHEQRVPRPGGRRWRSARRAGWARACRVLAVGREQHSRARLN